MSGFESKIDALKKLRFEPFSAKVVDVVKMIQVESTIVALGANGTIYSTAVKERLWYWCHGDTGALSHTLDGCIKLGVLTALAVKEHKDSVTAWNKKRTEKYQAEYVLENAEKLKIKLTAAQLKKLNALKEPV